MNKFVTVAAAIASFGFVDSASAADMPTKAPAPMMAPVYNWTGFYVGLNAGWAWGKSDVNYVPPGLPFTTVVAAYSAIGSGTVNSNGFTGGIQAGYNWQTGPAVFGIEADFNAFNLRGSFTQVGTPPANATLTSNASIQTNWLGTVRGRLGWAAFDRALIYVTGGLAITDFQYSQSNTYAVVGTNSFSSNTTRAGWTVGGGLEYAFAPRWTAKVEYLYMDFGSVSGLAPPLVAGGQHSYSANLTANLVRGGINYRF